MREAIRLSMQVSEEQEDAGATLSKSQSGSDIDEDLQRALQMSLHECQSPDKGNINTFVFK